MEDPLPVFAWVDTVPSGECVGVTLVIAAKTRAEAVAAVRRAGFQARKKNLHQPTPEEQRLARYHPACVVARRDDEEDWHVVYS